LKKIHEGNTGYEYDKFERANFDLDFLGSKTPEVEQRERRPTMKIKVDESIVRRSFRLFKGQSFTDGFLTHMDVPMFFFFLFFFFLFERFLIKILLLK